ncbi:MAG: carbamoyltransferase N-terminal domain-containing protein [Candidatus Lernaella stagnicola]|nr:carbamoyltransferase N-terminal domain-containing protein [Candidatus Lernaella stagnicola]
MVSGRLIVGAVISDHDSSVALLRDGRLVAAINEERLCRVRRGDPRNSVRRALQYVLAEAGAAPSDVDLLVCDTTHYYPPGGHPPITVFPEFPPEKTVQLDHHLGHVASAFLPSPFDEAAVLSVDASGGIAPLVERPDRWGFLPRDIAFRDRGFLVAHRHPPVGELLRAKPEADARNYAAESLSLAHCVRGEVLVEIDNHMAAASLGYFYALCAHFLAMEEGSLMGLAGHAGPNDFDAVFEEILRLEPDGRVAINPDWLCFWSGDHVLEDPVSIKRMAPRWFEAFGDPRQPDDELTERDRRFAYAAQHRLEEALVHVASHLHEATGSPNLCVAGGVGLNSVANQIVLARTPFENIFIQPAASDDGLALGYALFADYVLAELPAQKRWTMATAFTGRTYRDEEIESFFNQLENGKLVVEYLEAIPETRSVDVLWKRSDGAEGRTPLRYDAGTRRWRGEIDLPPGTEVSYEFESVGAPIESYLYTAQSDDESQAKHAPEFRKFLRDHRDLAGVLDGERAFVGPEQVVIDATNRCNNNCLPCWTNSPLLGELGPRPDWHRQEMPSEQLLRLLDEVADLGTQRVRFTGGGEPLLHPAIFEAVERVKQRGMVAAMTTNFSAIDEAGVRRLAQSGLDELTVSLWAGTPTTYSRSHPNKTERTFDRIEALLKLYHERKAPHQEVIMANVLFSMNFQETREMLDFALRVGAEGVYYTLVDSVHERTDGLLLTPPHLKVVRDHLRQVKQRVDAVVAEGRRFRLDNWDGLTQRLEAAGAARGDYDKEAVEAIPCYVGWMFLRILPTGIVAPCCRGTQKPMGDLNEQSFAEIWDGPAMREFRRYALRERKSHPYFAPIGCHRTCDNLMHNREMHRRLKQLTAEEREHLRRFVVEEDDV